MIFEWVKEHSWMVKVTNHLAEMRNCQNIKSEIICDRLRTGIKNQLFHNNYK